MRTVVEVHGSNVEVKLTVGNRRKIEGQTVASSTWKASTGT
jgi:hypothetical protein